MTQFQRRIIDLIQKDCTYLEIYYGIIALLWGVCGLFPSNAISTLPSYAVLASICNETWPWALASFTLGGVVLLSCFNRWRVLRRIAALIVLCFNTFMVSSSWHGLGGVTPGNAFYIGTALMAFWVFCQRGESND